MLTAFRIPPGLYASGTDYQAKGRWRDANLIRFTEGRIEPIGGWQAVTGVTLDSPGRGMHSWRADNGGLYAGVGTVDKLWVFDGDGAYDITPVGLGSGNTTWAPGAGYGAGDYGSGNYGSSGSGGKAEATSWSLDNFGQYMVACASHDGDIYSWDLVTANPAAVIANAPTARSIFVTAERFLIAIGAGANPRRIAWSDQEDYDTWTPTSINQAGDLLLQTEGVPIRGVKCRGQSLILTTTDAHTMRYLGGTFVYGFERVGESCGIVGTNAVASLNGGAAWMGYGGFFMFDGTAVRPIACEVTDRVFTSLNTQELAQVWAEHRAGFGEVIWHYPSTNSTYCDRYVTWNYRENHWCFGELARSCGVDNGVFSSPLAASPLDHKLYWHETGWTDNGALRGDNVYIASGPIEIGDGDSVLIVRQVLPDEVTPGAFRLRLATKFNPEGITYPYGPYALVPYTDVRCSGRQLALRIEGVRDEDSRIGTFRLDIVPGGRR